MFVQQKKIIITYVTVLKQESQTTCERIARRRDAPKYTCSSTVRIDC